MKKLFTATIALAAFAASMTAADDVRHYQMAADANAVWVATSNGLVKYDKRTGATTTFATEKYRNITSVAVSPEGTVTVGCYGNEGVATFDGEEFTAMEFGQQKPQNVMALVYADGLWAGAEQAVFHQTADGWQRIEGPNQLAGNYNFKSLAWSEKDARMWFGAMSSSTQKDNFGYIDNNGLTVVPTETDFDVNDLYVQEDGTVVLATSNGMLTYADGKFDILDYNLKDIPADCSAVAGRGYGKLSYTWLGAGNSVLRSSPKDFEPLRFDYTPADGHIDKVTDIVLDGNFIWVLFEKDGLKRLDNGSFEDPKDVNDFLGTYAFSSLDRDIEIKDDNYKYKNLCDASFMIGNGLNEIIIKDFVFKGLDAKAYIDPLNKIFFMPRQEIQYGNDIITVAFEIFCDCEEPFLPDQIRLYTDEDGNVIFEADVVRLFAPNDKLITEIYYMRYSRIPDRFDPADQRYEYVGDVKFKDDFVNVMLSEEYRVGEQTVKAYKSKAGSQYVIYNPYSSTAWAEVNAATEAGRSTDGVIYLDLMDKRLVMMRPLTGSGMWMNVGNGDTDQVVYKELYPYNDEGYYFYIYDYDTDIIYDLMYNMNKPMSVFDLEKGTIWIPNLICGVTGSVLHKQRTDNITGSFSYHFSGFDFSGVAEVESDSDAPVRYFNLQGMEVKNPAKGELMIKRQGSKSVKMIMR